MVRAEERSRVFKFQLNSMILNLNLSRYKHNLGHSFWAFMFLQQLIKNQKIAIEVQESNRCNLLEILMLQEHELHQLIGRCWKQQWFCHDGVHWCWKQLPTLRIAVAWAKELWWIHVRKNIGILHDFIQITRDSYGFHPFLWLQCTLQFPTCHCSFHCSFQYINAVYIAVSNIPMQFTFQFPISHFSFHWSFRNIIAVSIAVSSMSLQFPLQLQI